MKSLAYNGPTSKTSASSVVEPLTPEFMRLLCRDLRNDWERFAKELRIGRARLQSIKQQNKNTIPEKIVMDILANWLKRQPKVNDKVNLNRFGFFILLSLLRRFRSVFHFLFNFSMKFL